MTRPKYMIDGEYAPPTSPSPNINPSLPPDGSNIETVEDAEAYITHAEEYDMFLENEKSKADAERDAIVEAEWPKIGTAVYKEEGGDPVYLYKKGKGSYTQESFTAYQQDTDQLIANIEAVQEANQGNIDIVSAVIEVVASELVVAEDVAEVPSEPVLEESVSQPPEAVLIEQPYVDAHLETPPYKAPKTETPEIVADEVLTPFVPASNIGLLESSGGFGVGQGWGGGESDVRGADQVLISNLPDPDTFEGIPGPAAGPAPGSLGEKIQDAIMEPITELEKLSADFESEMSGAGKQAGVEAQEAYAEGDYLEAGLKGMASGAALLGAGAFQDLTFFIRPLAMGKAIKGIGQVVTDRDLESEEAARQIRDTVSKGESDYAGYQSNYDAVMAQYADRQVEADLIFSTKEDYTPESYAAWESSWIKYSSDVVGLKTSHAETKKDYEAFTEWRLEATDLLAELDKSPRTRVSESVVNAFTSDQGAIVQFVGGIFSGYLMSKAFSALKGPTKKLTRLDDLDITVRSTTLDINQFPEAELFPSTSTRKLPKIVSEILEPELDDLKGGRIIGVADDGNYSLLTKIDLPEGVMDDLLEGKTVDVQYRTNLLEDQVVTKQGTIGVENIVWGREKFAYVDEITDPITGAKMNVNKQGNALLLDAKEIGGSIAIPESSTGKMVEFNSLWDVEGTKGILPKGKYSFDIKGMIPDSTLVLDDIIEDIPHIEPIPGPKTPFAEHFQQPGYTEPLGDLGESLARDMDIVRNLADDIGNININQGVGAELSLINELTQGAVPVSKVITKASKSSPSVAAAMGFGGALDFTVRDEPVSEPSGSPIDFNVSMDDLGLMPNLERVILDPVFDVKDIEETKLSPIDFTVNMKDIAVILQPIHDKKTSIDFVPIIDFKPIVNLDIADLKPKPVPDIVPVPPIEVVYPIEIPDIITIPELDTTPIPIQDTIQKPDQILDMSFPPMFDPNYNPLPFLIRPPKGQGRGKPVGPFSPMGYEFKKYPESAMMAILGVSYPKSSEKKRKKKKTRKKRTKK